MRASIDTLLWSSVLCFTFTAVRCTSDLAELPSEFDLRAEIVAMVAPDTAAVQQKFAVHIGFPNVCGGVFSRVDEFSGSAGLTLTPVLHVVPTRDCSTQYEALTSSTQVSFGASGVYEIVASGQFGSLRKEVVIQSHAPAAPDYSIRYLFLNQSGLPKAYQEAVLWFPDREDNGVAIQSDSSGAWSTTFSDTIDALRYALNGYIFTARRGVPESGLLLFQ